MIHIERGASSGGIGVYYVTIGVIETIHIYTQTKRNNNKMKRQAGNGRELRPNCHKNQLITRGRLLETVYRRPECTH